MTLQCEKENIVFQMQVITCNSMHCHSLGCTLDGMEFFTHQAGAK